MVAEIQFVKERWLILCLWRFLLKYLSSSDKNCINKCICDVSNRVNFWWNVKQSPKLFLSNLLRVMTFSWQLCNFSKMVMIKLPTDGARWRNFEASKFYFITFRLNNLVRYSLQPYLMNDPEDCRTSTVPQGKWTKQRKSL